MTPLVVQRGLLPEFLGLALRRLSLDQHLSCRILQTARAAYNDQTKCTLAQLSQRGDQ
jgi:hypothetical protein